MIGLQETLGKGDLLLVTLDTLRFDVADEAWRAGATPLFSQLLPGGWDERHSPGSFTFAAHAAFFAGFFPTPCRPGVHPRPFALKFPGSRTTGPATCQLQGATIVEGLSRKGYHTICIGGVGFFSKLNPLGSVFPNLFAESHWSPQFAVTEPSSTRHQVQAAIERLAAIPSDQPVFLFVNVSALHSPNHFYLPGAKKDSPKSQAAALSYVDRELGQLIAALQARGRGGAGFLMSDHGTAYGEDGYEGHRLAHPVVWTVPYGEFTWRGAI